MAFPNGSPMVVGVDGSPDSLRAVAWAADVAQVFQLHVEVLYALGRDNSGRASSVANAAVADALARRYVPFRDVTASDVEGDAVPLLLEAGKRASAVVVGARGHGRLTGAVTGSVSQHVAGLASCPVVVVREPADPTSRTVVLGVDEHADQPGSLSPGSAHAAQFAFAFAQGMSAPLTVMRAWHDPYLDRSGVVLAMQPELAAEDLRAAIRDLNHEIEGLAARYPEVAVSRVVRPAHPQRLLTDASEHASLVVVGSRGRGAVAGMVLGSVSQSLLRHASSSVAVVR